MNTLPVSKAVAILLPLAFLAVACDAPRQQVEVRFAGYFGSAAIGCGTASGPEDPVLSDLRFYVQDLQLRRVDGSYAAVEFDAGNAWQSDAVGLVDLEDGGGACRNGSPQTNPVLRGSVPAGDYAGLRFVLGVPEALNHADPLGAAAPLNQTAMHWHWRSGYKFMRAGIATADDGYWLHLGSARCHGTIGDLQGCDASNRPRVELDEFDPARDVVAIDLARLFAAARTGDGVVQSCQMGPDEADCEAVQRALGLDPESGESIAASAVFRGVTRP